MKITPIFADGNTGEGLHAVRYDDQQADEFEKLFDRWTNTEYVTKYCVTNKQYIQSDYFKNLPIDQVITQIIGEAEQLGTTLFNLAEDGFENTGRNLQMLFRPLNNNQSDLRPLQESKGKVEKIRKAILRIYAIRIGPNTYVVTGGAIKLTRLMAEHSDTREELEKIQKVKNFLKTQGINCEDDLNYYYEIE